MLDDSQVDELRLLWKQQPEEGVPVALDALINRRRQQVHASTRSEIVMTMLAALFFIGILAWRLRLAGVALQPAGIAATVLWLVVIAVRFRHILRTPVPADDPAITGIEYYRRELEIRHAHLRNSWLWHGPLVLATILTVASLAGRAFPGINRLRNAMPLFLILAVWVVVGIRRRFRQAAEVQREIDEISSL